MRISRTEFVTLAAGGAATTFLWLPGAFAAEPSMKSSRWLARCSEGLAYPVAPRFLWECLTLSECGGNDPRKSFAARPGGDPTMLTSFEWG